MCPKSMDQHLSSPPRPISLPEKTWGDGSTPSQRGPRGEPSPSELRVLRALASRLMDGPELAPVLIGPLTITGPGSKDSDQLRHPLRSSRSKKVGEEGYIYTLYLDQETRTCLVRLCGEAGLLDTVAVSFGVSTPSLEPFTM